MPASSAVVWTGFTKTSGIECVGGQIKHACSNCGGGGLFEGVEKALKKQFKWFTPPHSVAGFVLHMSYFGALISTRLMVWFHLISGTSLTGEWSQSNVAILVFKTPKWCDKWNACEWRPHTCKLLFLDSLQHSAGRNASITPWCPLIAHVSANSQL